MHLSECFDQGCIPTSALFDDTSLRGIIDVDDAKTLAVSFSPFVVIHQGPDEVATQRRALFKRLGAGPDVLAQISYALWIINGIVTIPLILVGSSVLSDVESWHVILAVQAYQQIPESLRIDFPGHLSIAGPRHRLNRSTPVSELWLFLAEHYRAGIVVDPQEVDGHGDRGKVSV